MKITRLFSIQCKTFGEHQTVDQLSICVRDAEQLMKRDGRSNLIHGDYEDNTDYSDNMMPKF